MGKMNKAEKVGRKHKRKRHPYVGGQKLPKKMKTHTTYAKEGERKMNKGKKVEESTEGRGTRTLEARNSRKR